MPLTSARFLRSATAIVAVAAFGVASPHRAYADEKEACVNASEQAQTLRDDGKFRQARAALMTCGRDVCPGIVRRDCEKWLGELDAAQPTVVLGARDPNGNDVPAARVKLDGTPLLDRLDGRPVPVDPGEHVFRYEGGGSTPVEQRVVVRVGEKNRSLTAILMPPASAAAASPTPALVASSGADIPPSQQPEAPAEPRAKRPIPASFWIFSGLTVAGAASFTYFGLSGQSDINNLRATCSPNCAQSDVDAAHTKLVIADVSAVVGVAALTGAILSLVLRGKAKPATAALVTQTEVHPVLGGAMTTWTARF
ncbi:MAG TPA: hypothetical protein VGI39_07940 [Polyangiaceae bacterium]|jgi:hypothetical protein